MKDARAVLVQRIVDLACECDEEGRERHDDDWGDCLPCLADRYIHLVDAHIAALNRDIEDLATDDTIRCDQCERLTAAEPCHHCGHHCGGSNA